MESEAFHSCFCRCGEEKRGDDDGGVEVKEQFQRIAALIGEENASILQHKCVAIAGVGAVGGFACEMIARSGIGRIRIADFDVYEESNINRQIGALHSTIGRKKVDVMKERILGLWKEVETKVERMKKTMWMWKRL